jgi:endonuclease YncB( thermonuclease family)
MSIRVNGVDTPEIKTTNGCEKMLAKKTKEFVKFCMNNSKRIDLLNVSRGKYFRIVADVNFDDNDLKQQLLNRGYAVPYDGGTKQYVDWCEMLDKVIEKEKAK